MQKTQQSSFWLGIVLAAYSLLLVACGSDTPRYVPNVSGIQSDIQVVRFEREVFALDTTKISEQISILQQKYPNFAEIYFGKILGGELSGDIALNTKAFLAIPETRKLYDTVQLVYPNTDQLEKEVKEMLKYYQYYFAEDTTQYRKIYTYISNYQFGVFVLDDYIAIGLDFFLGADHQAYQYVENLRHDYIRRTLNREHLQAQIAQALAEDVVSRYTQLGGNHLIDYMLREGKKFYIVDALLPNVPDSIKFSFSQAQVEHCQQGELELYEHLAKEELLYSDKYADFRGYITVGPFNPELGLYGNSGSWLGMQIIRQYVNRTRAQLQSKQPDARKLDAQLMLQMLQETKPQVFLQKYKPAK